MSTRQINTVTRSPTHTYTYIYTLTHDRRTLNNKKEEKETVLGDMKGKREKGTLKTVHGNTDRVSETLENLTKRMSVQALKN